MSSKKQSKTSPFSTFVKTTFQGFLILVPLIALVYLIYKLYHLIADQVQQIIDNTFFENSYQVWMVFFITIAILVIISYAIGLLVKTKPFLDLIHKIDFFLIENSDLYSNFKLNFDNNLQFIIEDRPSIFVKFGATERPGFLMEKIESEQRCVVFIPKNFKTFNGNVYIVNLSDIRYSNCTTDQMIYSLEHLGAEMDIS